MNVCVLIGRLTSDPDIRDGENKTARFTLAVDRFRKDAGADFIRCIAFGKTADIIDRYTEKGKQVAVAGRVNTGSYKDKDGRTVYTTDIIISEIQLLSSQSPQERKTPEPVQRSTPERQNADSGLLDGFMNIPEDLPEELFP